MADSVSARHSEVHLGAQGRFVIPAELRRRLGFSPGDTLVARVEGDRLIVEKAEAVKRRLKERFQRVPKTVDLAAELIEERRRESAEEGGA